MSRSPQMSTAMVVDSTERNGGADQSSQPLSKREKRRTLVSDRLKETTNEFSNNRDQHYRQQLQAVQIDTALILGTDIYDESPLPDTGDAIAELVDKVIAEQGHAMIKSMNGEISNQAGKLYADFVKEINDAKEERDAVLTTNKIDYDRKVASIRTNRLFKAKAAEEEYRALAGTLRDRVINSVTAKKARLNRDKEGLDITDSNALLLHPSHFTSTIPGSPGGIHGKRSTRHRRDVEDQLQMFGDSHKRKRIVEDEESPAPSRRAFDNGSNTPLWQLESSRATSKQVDRPLYSIDKLFTDKELHMTYQTAAYAARNYILSHSHDAGSGSDTGSPSDDDMEPSEDEAVGAPAMERTFSHATRSTRNAGNSNFTTSHGIEALADFSTAANLARMSAHLPKLPPFIQAGSAQKIYTRENTIVHMPFNNDEISADLASIKRCKRLNEDAGVLGKNLTEGGSVWRAQLEAACAPPGQYLAWVQVRNSERERQGALSALRGTDDGIGLGVGGLGGLGSMGTLGAFGGGGALGGGIGGVPMSKTSSVGYSDFGGTTMSRTGSGNGGRGRRRGG